MDEIPLFPNAASTYAADVDLIYLTLIGLSGLITLGVLILIVYFSIRYRQGTRADRSNPPLTSLKLEIGWIIPLLGLSLGTFVWGWIVYFQIYSPPEEAVDIYVVGKQWMWKFQHEEGPTEINQLHVPQGIPVRLIMISQDVIHSFYVPAFRIKLDVIPGRFTMLWFEATETGDNYIFCAEFCGADHAEMIGEVIVLEPRNYQEWLRNNQEAEAASLPQSGQQVFETAGCSGCHGPGSQVNTPNLTGLFGEPVHLESGETVIADENYLLESILFPQRKIVSGYPEMMPSYKGQISEEDLVALVSYIKGLGTGPAEVQVSAGQQSPER